MCAARRGPPRSPGPPWRGSWSCNRSLTRRPALAVTHLAAPAVPTPARVDWLSDARPRTGAPGARPQAGAGSAGAYLNPSEPIPAEQSLRAWSRTLNDYLADSVEETGPS